MVGEGEEAVWEDGACEGCGRRMVAGLFFFSPWLKSTSHAEKVSFTGMPSMELPPTTVKTSGFVSVMPRRPSKGKVWIRETAGRELAGLTIW